MPLVRGGGGGRLALRFEGIQEAVDYTGQILPDGKSGLAMTIRLSAKKRTALKNFPVGIRLLTIPDVIKILSSAFLADQPAASWCRGSRTCACCTRRRRPKPILSNCRGFPKTTFGKYGAFSLSGSGRGRCFER